MSDFTVTVVIPVLNRPKNIEPFIASFRKHTPLDRAELLFVTGDDCQEEINEINKYSESITIAPEHVVSWARRINWGIEHSNNNTKFSEPSTWVLCCADDVVFHENWFEEAEKAAEGFQGVLGTNDLGNWGTICGEHATHPIVSRKYVYEQGTMDQLGKFCHEEYIHNYVDCEIVSTAKKRGAWKGVTSCKIEHFHPAWKKSEWDPIYQKGQDNWNHDRDLWVARASKFGLKT